MTDNPDTQVHTQTVMVPVQVKSPQEPVNRSRRALFIFGVVFYCLLMSSALVGLAAFGVVTQQIALITTLVNGFVGLAGIATVAYVGGSALDYNGGVGNIFRRGGADPYASAGYQYGTSSYPNVGYSAQTFPAGGTGAKG